MRTPGAKLWAAALGLASVTGSLAVASAPANLSFRQVTISTGKGARFVAVADVNEDGKPDLIVANDDAETLTVLLGDGKGTFHLAPGSPIPAGHLPNDIAVADMNGDGHLDLVIANHQSPYLRVLLGDGKGGFSLAHGSPIDVHSNPHPHGVAVGAFSGRGVQDVVTDSWGNNKIELLLGDGKGGLQTPGRYFNVGRRPYERPRSADFNLDGLPDIVTTNLDEDTVTILMSDGKGGFREATGSPFPAGAKPWQVAVGDFNRDGKIDLAIIPYERDVPRADQVTVTALLGDGKGGFSPSHAQGLSLEGCHGPNSLAIGDLNGDGFPDIVVHCAESPSLAIFLGGPGLRFSRINEPAESGWGGVAVADLNGDGKADIVTANHDNGTITVYLSK
ncbi:VCBS repeat-containing protein [Telmatobacter sp. DSM 110680]|uniref:VCBS repeat-containing protein n=1 Tax=Telmatobacter sp. DSM 110680 TaxID=3036704 RepID=A0AAU7DL71_9BACT